MRAVEAYDGPELSICFPVYNEERILPELLDRMQAVVRQLGMKTEVIAVDDGSRDGSLAMLQARRATFPELRIVSLSRNFGHPQACSAALDAASGRAVVLMDSDLQDPPELIPSLVGKWSEGFQVVYAQRKSRAESPIRRLFFWGYHRIFKASASVEIPVDAGNFCVMDRAVVEVLTSMKERHRYFPGLRAWTGFKQTAVLFDRPDRPDGKPKVSFQRLVGLAFDGIFSFSSWPLRVSSLLGALCSVGATLFGATVFVARLAGVQLGEPGWTSIVLLLVLFGGLVLVCLGIIGEYLGRIYEEIKARPYYIVATRIGFPAVAELEAPADGRLRARSRERGAEPS